MQTYLRRFFKYLLFFIFIFICANLPFLIKVYKQTDTLNLLWKSIGLKFQPVLLIATAVALIYPLLLFTKKEILANYDFIQNRRFLIDIFEKEGFIITKENDFFIIIRAKSKVKRFISFYEDEIVIEINPTSLVLDGYKKEVIKLYIALSKFVLKN